MKTKHALKFHAATPARLLILVLLLLFSSVVTATTSAQPRYGAGVRSVGQPLGWSRVPKNLETSIQNALNADTQFRTMRDNAIDALKGNQQAMISLIKDAEKSGSLSEAAIRQASVKEAKKSGSLSDLIITTFGHWDNGYWTFFGYQTGAKLTGSQISQMVGLAKQRRQNLWQQAVDTAKIYGYTLDPKTMTVTGGGGWSAHPTGARTNQPASSMPPQSVIRAARVGQYLHGPGGVSYQKRADGLYDASGEKVQ